jgi:hypothetical protein
LARSHGFSIRRHLRIYLVDDLSVVLPYDVTSNRINLVAGFRRFRMLFASVLHTIVRASKLLVPFLAVGAHRVSCYEERTWSSFFDLHHIALRRGVPSCDFSMFATQVPL